MGGGCARHGDQSATYFSNQTRSGDIVLSSALILTARLQPLVECLEARERRPWYSPNTTDFSEPSARSRRAGPDNGSANIGDARTMKRFDRPGSAQHVSPSAPPFDKRRRRPGRLH